MRRLRRIAPPLALLVAALASAAWPAGTGAAPAPGPPAGLTVVRASDYVPVNGKLDLSAMVTLAQPAREASVRFRVLKANGAVLYQHTESRSRLPAGPVMVPFQRTAKALGLKEGVYRLDVRVEASGHAPATATEQLLVVDDKRAPVTVAILIRVRGTPAIGPAGVPVSDPATATVARDEAVAAVQTHAVRPDLAFTLAVPPVLLDDWRRIAQGYEIPGTDAPISLDATVPSAYRDASRAMAAGAAKGLVFAGMPYAEPDIGGLGAMDAFDDLASQVALGARVASSTLHTPTVGAILDGSPLPTRAARMLGDHGVAWAVVATDSVPLSDGTTATPGAHRVEGSAMTLVVPDAQASALFGARATARTDFLAYLYKRASSKKDRDRPVIVVLEVGEDAGTAMSDLQASLAALSRVKWVRMAPLRDVAARPSDSVLLPSAARPPADAEAEAYWRTVAAARQRALALRVSAEPKDRDGIACERAIMLAESRGVSSSRRETGVAYATEAADLAMASLGKVTLTTPDVTLSGTSGKVRTSVSNGSGKVLTLAVTATPQDMRVLREPKILVAVPPGETIITVPVEARGSLKGTLDLVLTAGTLELATTRSTVSAGFMDRLAVVGFVVLVLLGLLWYIRSKGREAVAGIREAAGRMPRVGRSKDAS